MKYSREWYCYWENREWRSYVTDDAILQVKKVRHKYGEWHYQWEYVYQVRLLYPKAWIFRKIWIADGVPTLEDSINKANAFWNSWCAKKVKKGKRK